jgi:hypothetical protein
MQQEFDSPTGYQFIMKLSTRTKRIHKETGTQVATGLLINYPLNLSLLYIFIDKFGITDPLTLGTLVTCVMTVVAYTRIFLIRSYFDKHKTK